MADSSFRPSKLADAVADHIQQLILEGALQPGDRLISERDLAVKLEVSRPSLRDALDKLITEGLLTTDGQGIAYVSELVGKSLREPLSLLLDTPEGRTHCMEMRAVIEAAAAGFAAERGNDVDRAKLREKFLEMEQAHAKADVEAVAHADADFHFVIYEASHNLMLLHMMQSLESILRSNVYVNRRALFEHREQKDLQLEEHRAIFNAIYSRDAAAAQAAARDHMMAALQTQQAIYETERRMEESVRRLQRRDLVAPPKGPGRRSRTD